MNTTTYLQKQFANLNAVFHSIVNDLTDAEWLARPAPGQNRIGYSVWHIPRMQDNIVQTWIRNTPEVLHGDRWANWQSLKMLGAGAGISLEQADAIARSVNKAEVSEYADAVHQEISVWLAESSDDDLDQLFDHRQRLLDFPEYQTPGYIEEITNLYDQPVWSLLMRPCMGHAHRHLGELEIVKAILRTQREQSQD